MSGTEDKVAKKNIHNTLAKGALVNALGIVGKLATPVFFIVITRLYGPEVMGTYYLASTLVSIAVSLTVSGLRSGVLMFAARFQEAKEEGDEALYDILANGFVVSLLISLLLIAFSALGGTRLVLSRYPQPDLPEALWLMAWAIPFSVIPPLVISATKALIIMKWDAIIDSFLIPFSLLVFSVILYFIEPGIRGLMLSYLLANMVMAGVSLFVFARYFSFYRLAKAVFHFRLSKPLLAFSIPQSFNTTFNQLIGSLDVVMLGYFAYDSAVIGFYAMGAQIVRNLRQVKLAFSGIYAPIIARLHQRKDTGGINHSFSMVSRWTAMIGFPIGMLMLVFRNELLLLFHPTFTSDSTFMFVLLIPPLLSCSVGLAGNILVMTGHSVWNLTNSLSVAGINALLCYLLIPRYGLMGAAISTSLSGIVVSLSISIEVYFLEGAHLVVRRIYKPFVALLPGVALMATYHFTDLFSSTAGKVALAVMLLASYVGILFLMGFEQEDKETFFPKRYAPRIAGPPDR